MFAWIRSFQLVVSLAVLAFLLVLGGCVSGGGGKDSGPIQLQERERLFPIRSIKSG